VERGDSADGDAIDRFSRTWLKIFRFNDDVIKFDRRAKSRAFGFPDKINQVVRGDNCCPPLARATTLSKLPTTPVQPTSRE